MFSLPAARLDAALLDIIGAIELAAIELGAIELAGVELGATELAAIELGTVEAAGLLLPPLPPQAVRLKIVRGSVQVFIRDRIIVVILHCYCGSWAVLQVCGTAAVI